MFLIDYCGWTNHAELDVGVSPSDSPEPISELGIANGTCRMVLRILKEGILAAKSACPAVSGSCLNPV
jgi:hypothetical protein